ncbi:MAG: YCF48-related protein [Ferruginibacter sp.]
MRHFSIPAIVFCIASLTACQKSGVEATPPSLPELTLDSLQTIHVNIPFDKYQDMVFINDQTGLAVSRTGKIIKTTDGGNNWKNTYVPVNSDLQLDRIQFVGNNTFYAAGNDYSGNTNNYIFGLLLKSTDGGDNWNIVNTPVAIVNGMHFFDTQNGFISGSSGVLRTRDGGQSWTTSLARNVMRVNFKNRDEGISTALHGVYYKTNNGGITWDSIKTTSNALLYDVYFAGSRSFVTLLGGQGNNLIDLGNYNANLPQTPSCLYADSKLIFLDENKCIAVGYVYNPGGWTTQAQIYITNDCWKTSQYNAPFAEKYTAIAKVSSKKIMMLGFRSGETTVMIYKF